MPTCYLIPGFGGTALNDSTDGNFPLWVNYQRLSLGEIGRMRLGPDGISPGPPDGVQMYPLYLLEPYYGPLQGELYIELSEKGWAVLQHPYDFRLSIVTTGGQLADRIRAEVTAADPCGLVAHSLGGLVARVAWANLVGTGQENLVRRIVTLGTPHYGCYRPVHIWSADEETVQQLYWATTVVRTVVAVPSAGFLGTAWSKDELSTLLSTWPSLYELMPNLGAPDAASDPNRRDLYDAAKYPASRGVQQQWLDHMRNVTGPLLASPASFPPPWILTTVAGTGLTTADALAHPHLLGTRNALSFTDDADFVTTKVSALLPESKQVTVNCRHIDLSAYPEVVELVPNLVLEVRHAPDPPPPPVVVNNPLTAVLWGPPFPGAIGLAHDC